MRLPQPPLLVITDRRQARRPLAEVAAAAFAGGCRWLSLREKDLAPIERGKLLQTLVALGRDCGAAVMVHEDIAAAVAADAAGVHLPADGSPAEARRQLGPHKLIGLSAHRDEDIVRAVREGADYVTLSPVFLSASKPGYGPAIGLEGLRASAARAGLPIVALGGIDAAHAGPCLIAGAAAVAVMGGVMAAADPAAATAALVASLGAALAGDERHGHSGPA